MSDTTERERLARVVFGCHYDVFPWTDAREAEREDYRRIADAILAAGFGDVTAAKAAALEEAAAVLRESARKMRVIAAERPSLSAVMLERACAFETDAETILALGADSAAESGGQ